MLLLNPNATEARLRGGLEFNDDDTLKSWNLEKCNLQALPSCFGALCTTGDLGLDNNKLMTLPDSIGKMYVGGTLSLSDNRLESLPLGFRNVKVGGNLWLNNNQLPSSEIPSSFPNVKGEVSHNATCWVYAWCSSCCSGAHHDTKAQFLKASSGGP